MKLLEVIALNVDDARASQTGGADSLEIIENLPLGGLTPPLDVQRAIRDAVQIKLNVLIRPHARDFVYTPDEIELILRDAEQAMRIGADGIVFGALTGEGDADFGLFDQVTAVCRSINPAVIMTFHRAIEAAHNPDAVLQGLVGKADRVLCSGLLAGTSDGAPRTLLRDWVQSYGSRIHFACGGGLTLASLPDAIKLTGAPEYHFGGAGRTNDSADPVKVRALRDALDQA